MGKPIDDFKKEELSKKFRKEYEEFYKELERHYDEFLGSFD